MEQKLQSLVAKLAAACDAVGGVEKLGKNEQQGYKYVKAADVAKAIRHELFRRGVVVLGHEHPPEFIAVELAPDREGRPRTMSECHLRVTYRLMDGTEMIEIDGYGVARDSGDKAIYKAKTGALKYFLRGLGLIPDEKDDPEFDEDGNEVKRRGKDEQADFAKEKIERMKQEAKPAPAPALPKDSTTITEGQRKRLFAIAREKGWSETALRDLVGSHGFEHTSEITRKAYDAIVQDIEASQVIQGG